MQPWRFTVPSHEFYITLITSHLPLELQYTPRCYWIESPGFLDTSLDRVSTVYLHYTDVTMGSIASQITSLNIVYSAVYSGAYQRKHQSSALLAIVRGIHRGPVNSPHKWPVTQKMFPFDDVFMSGSIFKISFGSGDALYCLFSVRFFSLTNDYSLAIRTSWTWLSDLWEMFKENVSENVHQMMGILSGALFQYPIRLLILRSLKVSKPRDLYLKLSSRSETWQAHR